MSTYRHVADSAPYYDDYVGSNQEEKGYVKVLWKPSRAVQARELTQMQTYAQKQTAELGGYLFKDGTIVHGGIISTTTKQKYFIAELSYPTGMSLEDAMAGFTAYNKIGAGTAASESTGLYPQGIDNVKFQLVGWATAEDPDAVTDNDPDTGYSTTTVVVFYNLFGGTFANPAARSSAGAELVTQETRDAATSMTFSNPVADVDSRLKVVRFFNSNMTSVDDIYMTCTRAFCTKGTLFVDGYFINCPMGDVLVNPITIDTEGNLNVSEIDRDNEEYNIGFWIDRKIVDAYEDPTLTDPASGTYNHKAPGADRYSILAKLTCFSGKKIAEMTASGLLSTVTEEDIENGGGTEGIKFVSGIVMKNNIITKEQSNVGANSELMDEMARRTYEESGNYTVQPWKVQIEDLQEVNADGETVSNPAKYKVSVGPGLGYIYGYRVSTVVSQIIENDKSREILIRPVSSKYSEESLSVASDDIYTLNDASEGATRNIHSCHLNKVISSGSVVLLDAQLGERAVKYDETDPESWSSLTFAEMQSQYPQWITDKTVNILGTASVTTAGIESEKSIRIWILNVDGVSNLSNVSCIAAVDSNGGLLGYIDLLHETEGNLTKWSAVEEPLIFETDWPYVAPDETTYAEYVTTVFKKSTNAYVPEGDADGLVRLKFDPPLSVGAPRSDRDVNFLVNETTGELIPASKIKVFDASTDASFQIQEITSGTLSSSAGQSYWISYQGIAKVESQRSSANNVGESSLFRRKTLTMATQRVTAAEIAALANAYSQNASDILQLKDGDVAVTDLVKILAIEETSPNESQTNTPANTEIYWNVADGISSTLEISDGCTDWCYMPSTVKGIGKWYANKAAGMSTDDAGTETASIALNIVFVYWKHESDSTEGFYYAGSYGTSSSVQFASAEKAKADAYKKRLSEWFNVESIGTTTVDAYKLIPKYKSKSGAYYDLANCFDFRPDWNGNGEMLPAAPIPSTGVVYRVATYQPRIDTVWVDKHGNFGITKGTPSDNPIVPREKDGTMTIYNIYNKPYGKTTADIILEYIDNARHTMVDITAVANRIANLEEVVSMSMAEQSAANMQITDEDGISRYKCGIFTDNFGSFSKCDFGNPEWSATIDTVDASMRADFESKDWGFSLVGTYIKNGTVYELDKPKLMGASSDTVLNVEVYGRHNYHPEGGDEDASLQVGGTILTLKPMVNEHWVNEKAPSQYSWTYAKNDAFTETTNVQSMMFVVWNGNLVLTPAIDTWTNDLGEIITESWEDSEQPPDTYRSWTTTSTGSTTKVTTSKSSMTLAQLDAMYGTNWRNVPKEKRVTHLPGWWEPITTTTTTTKYKTITSTKMTEKTTYVGSWQANDVSTYMEVQDSYMRIRKVKFQLEGMRPNQTFKASMDNVPLKLMTVAQFNNANTKETDYLDSITTDSNGKAEGYFVVPDKMPTGTKLVEFFDGEDTSAASSDYTANGKTVWTDVNRTYIRTWSPKTSVSKGASSTKVTNEVLSQKSTSKTTQVFHNNDPIAESFYVEEPNGITLESIQVYFATKDPSVGAEIFIVECEGGYPGDTIVPFSRVFVPSSQIVLTDPKNIPKTGPAPTTFKFPVPLQLQGLKEYAFVVIAASYAYEIYTSTLGKADLVTSAGVREQPYIGTMYKSQNLRTWTAEPYSDVSFRMYTYKFNTAKAGEADFALDDFVSDNTGMGSTIPETGQTNEAVVGETNSEGSNVGSKALKSFLANSMNIAVGNYAPASTAIQYQWYFGTDPTKGTTFENRQDIFLDDPQGAGIARVIEDDSTATSTIPRVKNENCTLKVRVTMSTSDENIAPQIDLEDFHGIFSRNLVNLGSISESIDGVDYYDGGTYISNTITLKDPAIGLKVALDAILPGKSKLKVYYKASGTAGTSESMWSPGLETGTVVEARDVWTTGEEGGTEALPSNWLALPGVSDADLAGVCGKRSYIWYWIYDKGDQKTKFILPNQMAYDVIDGYSHTSCIIEKAAVDGTVLLSEEGADAKAKKVIIKNPVNMEILPQTMTYSVAMDESNPSAVAKRTVRWDSMSNKAEILGVFAIPIDSANGSYPSVFDPETINSKTMTSDANFKAIECLHYSAETVYTQNDICLWNGVFWKCIGNRVYNLEPSIDAMSWEKIPCCLFVSTKKTEKRVDSDWEEMTVDPYKNSTERETNYMEYTYSSNPASELNEFDSFLLKAKMLAMNTRDIPKFRNLRAVAVY